MKKFLSIIFLTFAFFLSAQNSPVANDSSFTLNEGSSKSGSLSGSDVDGDALTYTLVGSPTSGTVTIQTNGSFSYVHSGDEGTSDSFTFKITDDENLTSNTATVTVTVTPVNDAPTLEAISKTIDEGASSAINVSATDPEGTILEYVIVTSPSNGTFTLDKSTGVGYYTHNGGETTSDSIVVKASETTGDLLSTQATISITVTAVNDAPVSPDASISVNEGSASADTSFGVTDADTASSSITVNITNQGTYGTAVVTGTNFVYTHDGSETTTDSFTYNASDGALNTTGTITVTISPQNDAPVGVADTYYITRNSTTDMSAEIGVLRNDTDSDSDSSLFTVSLGSTNPAFGQLTLNPDGSFSYVTDGSNTSFNSDTFSYTVSDGTASSSEVTVTLEVAEILPVPNSYSNTEGGTLAVDAASGVIVNDIEPNGLSITASLVANPSYGTLTLNTDGSFNYVHDGSENRKDVFTYKLINANEEESKSTFVVINNTNVNDAPTSGGTSLTLDEGAASTFTPTYTDTDTELSGITFTVTTEPANGLLTANLIDNVPDGTLTYTHNGGETTTDSFKYSVSDGEFTIEDISATITVTPVNDVPTANNLLYTLNEGASQIISFEGTDPEGTTLDFVVLTNPNNGSISTVNGVTTYTHNGSETDSDSFTYASYDGTVQSAAATVSLTISPVNSPPTVSAVAFTIDEDASNTFNLANSSTEPEGQTMTFAHGTPANGSITAFNADTGEITYKHDGSETTSDTFTYTAIDADNLSSSSGKVTVTINPVNDKPTIIVSALSVDQYDELTFNMPGDDAEGDALTYTIVTNPTQGVLEDNGGGSYTYYNNTETDIENSTASDTFVVKANDGSLDSDNTTLTFTINGIDQDLPQIILTSNSNSITETSSGDLASMQINAVLISNDFYSQKRDMKTAAVAVGSTNSLGYIYLGEHSGHKYYYKNQSYNNSDASTEAATQEGYLWTIESAAEESAVRTLLSAQGYGSRNIWLGYNYDYNDNTWKWINSHTLSGGNFVVGSTYKIVSLGDTTQAQWNTTAGTSDVTYAVGALFTAATTGTGTGTAVYEGFNQNGSNGYDTSTDSGGFLERPVAYSGQSRWYNTTNNAGAYIILEFDNNVTASENITFQVAASGAATENTDYTLSASTITIESGDSSGALTLTEARDADDEPQESVVLTASSITAGSARIKSSQNSIELNIIDNELTTVTLSTPSNKVVYGEADGSIVITAELTNVKPFDTAMTLDLSGDATIDKDYSTNDDGYLQLLADSFSNIRGLVQSTSNDFYLAEYRKMYKVETDGTKTALGPGGYGSHSATNQPITQALYRDIRSIAIDKSSDHSFFATDGDASTNPSDVIYIADQRIIRKFDLGKNLVYFITGSNSEYASTDGTLAEGRFRNIQDIAVSNDGNKIYVIEDNKIRTVDLVNETVSTLTGHQDWSFVNGSLSNARFQGPRSIAMDSNDNLIVSEYGSLRKIDIENDLVSTLVNNQWGWGDLFIDGSDNIYYTNYDRHMIELYSSDGELSRVMDSYNSSGTVDGVLKDAKISRPDDILISSAGNLIFSNEQNKLRKIDFINKLRIPAGSKTGTFTLNINDDTSYELDETINLKITSAESITIDPTAVVLALTIDGDGLTDGVNNSLTGHDSAPAVNVVAASSSIEETNGSTILTFQLGNAGESGARQDMSAGQKDNYIYLGNNGDSKYYLSKNGQNWTDAKNTATDLGGYLVAIDSAEENSWIRDKMEDEGYRWDSVWIGYTDENSEGQFEWVNGSDNGYENWSNGEPNNSGGEDYTELLNNGKWNDLPNRINRRFVIEFSGTVSSLPTVITFEATTSSDGQFTLEDITTKTIPAGENKATITVSSISDEVDEGTDTVTYTITDVTNGDIGSKSSAVVSIKDDDYPTVTLTKSADSFIEKDGELVITATIDNAKTFESSLGITVNNGGSDTAVFGKDYVISELQNVKTFAGSGTSNYTDGTGILAAFDQPNSIVSKSGDIFVADKENNVIRKITSAGEVSTYAGNGNWAHDREEGAKTDVGFARPKLLAFNSAGEMFIFEEGRQRISKIDLSGNVSKVIGEGWGDQNGNKSETQFGDIQGMAFDSAGNLFVSDNGKIRKITFDISSGDASSEAFAGTGNWGYIEGAGTDAEFREPAGIVIDASDNLYVADRHNHRIRKITSSGVVSTYAGDGHGYQDGSLLSARFGGPYGLSLDSNGDIFVSTTDGHRIRKIDVSEGTVSTIAGSGSYGYLDSDLLSSKFKSPRSILATSSAIYVADTDNHRIRKIDLTPSIKIPSGSNTGTLTLKGLDDFVYEVAETISVNVNGVVNVKNSTYDPIALTLTSGDDPPIVKLSVDDNILDEESAGTTNVTVSLSDVYSSSKIDMDASDKSNYYYLGTYKGSKYYSSKNEEHLNYTDAKAKATALGGQLAIITSSGEQETIVNGIYAQDPDYSSSNPWLNHWIGLDYDENSNWVWLNGIVSDYENWDSPWWRDEHSRREAAYLHTNGLWYSTRERDHRRFVVEFSSAISDSNTIVDISFADSNSSGTTLEGETNADFSSNLVSGKLTVPAGSSSGNVVLTAVDDGEDEPIESFNVNLTSVSYNGVDDVDVTSNNTALITINDNDLTEIALAVENATDTISEVGGQTKLIATLDNAKLYPVSVDLSFAESGDLIALFGQDYDSSDLNSVSTFSGSGNTGYLDGDSDDARFSNNVRNIISDSSGNIFVADMENGSIRKIDSQGNVSTFYRGSNWENELRGPSGMAFDSSGNMYVAEEWNNRISKIDTQGNLSRFANQDGQWGSNNGNMTEVRFEGVRDVVFDTLGNLLVLENHRIRKIEFSGDLISSSDFVGSGNHGFQDGTGSDVRIGSAQNIVVDSKNNVYFADQDYQRIRKVTSEGVVTTIAGNGNWDFADGFGTNAKFRNPHTLAIDAKDNIYVSDRENNRIRKLVLQSDGNYKVSTIAGDGSYGYVNGSADQSQFKQVTALAENGGTLYAYDRDEYKFRNILLNPVMSITPGSKTASFNIRGLDDNAYESTESIIVTPSASGATLKSSEAITIKLTSNEITPKVVIKSESAVLNENAGTLTFDVVLVDATGAASNWTNTELPTASAQDFDYMGEYNGRKYYFSKSYYTWTQAKENAERLGGQMLVIDDQAENDFVASIMIRNGTWIGHSRPTEADSWTNIYGDVNFQNFQHVADGGNISDLTGYAVTYGGKWYNNQDQDTRAYILEYGPVASSELESSVQLVYSGSANIGKDVDGDGNNINDYSTSATIATIAPNTQKTTVTLTGIDDSYEENIEEITVTLALRTDPDDASVVISNVDLGDVVSKTFQVSDDEEPEVTFSTDATEISENGGVVRITASLSNPKLAETTVNMVLEGTSTQLVDYEVSSIFGYKDFVGERGTPGVSEGVGSQARFENPLHMIEYIDGSILVSDYGSFQIKKIDSNGLVTNFLGKAYNRDNDTGDASEARINMRDCEGQMVADLSNGDLYWTSCDRIYKYDVTANSISMIYDYGSRIGGIALYNNEVYFSGFYKYTINKLTYDGSNYSHEVFIGNEDNASYESNRGTQKPFSDNFHYYPTELIVDQARNKMYVNFYGILDNWDYGRKRLVVVDFSNSTWMLHSDYNTTAEIPNNGRLSTVMLNKSNGNIYMAYDNNLRSFATDDKGILYVQDDRDMSQFGRVTSGVVVGSSLYVSDFDNRVIGKVNLGPSIDIPAGQTTGTLVLSAFKDPWFESDETIDANVSSISNGFSNSTDAADVNILESTKLTLVESPFEGVQNGKVSWGDYDRDGDMDLALMGDASSGVITNVYRNDGNDEDGNPIFENTKQSFTKVIGGDIEFVDVNQDGWLDVAVSGNSEIDGRISKLYLNNGNFFEESVSYSEQVEGLSQADMEWADVDNDSDPDLIITGIDNDNNLRSIYYTNIGNGNFFKETQFYMDGFMSGEIDIVDNNNDGDNDLYITGLSGNVNNSYYRTRQVDNTYYWGGNNSDVSVGYSGGNTEYLDIDGDGLMDFLSIGRYDTNSTDIASTSNLMNLNYLPKLKNTDFDFADYNNDGLSDVVISGEDEAGVGVTKLFVTYSDLYGSNYQLVETDLVLTGLRDSSVDWIDYDKDGDLDLFITGLDNDGPKSLLYKAENLNNLNTPPSKVENVQVDGVGNNGTLRITWDKPSDDYSSSFRYSVRVGTSPGASDVLYSNSITDEGDKNGSTLLDISSLTTRTNMFLTVKPGTYYVSVQAIDGGNMGGPFSDEVSASVDYAWNLQRLGGIIDRRLRTSESSTIKFIDIDKDGDKDLIGGNVGTSTFGQSSINVFVFQNDIFEPKRQFFGGVSSFEIADFNKDGNEDIVVGVEETNGTRIYLLLNTYNQDEDRDDGYREYFTVHYPFNGDNLFESLYNIKFGVKDLDNDGLMDIMVAGESSKVSSEATAVVGISSIVPYDSESKDLGFQNFGLTKPKSIGDDKLSGLSFISFDFGDIDNDSDYDFLISGYGFDGYETILYENKRLRDENGAVVQPIEVYFEEKETNFVSVKDGTTQFVDFDSDGKLDIIFSGQSGDGDIFTAYKNTGNNNFSVIDLSLPPVRNGNFAFGDMFGRGVNDVIYSGTVSGQGTFSRIAYYEPNEYKFYDSGYDLFLDDASIGLADFDGDLDTDVVLTGKWNGDPTNYNYHGYVYMNVRGYVDQNVANSESDNGNRTSSVNGVVRNSSSDDGAQQGSSLNTRPNAPSTLNVQKQRIAENSYDVFISWSAGSDDETPVDALTYSLKIGTSDGGEEVLVSGANSEGVRNTGTTGNASTNRSWKLTLPEGTYYASVQSVDASFIGSEFSSTKEFTVKSSNKLGDSNGDDSVNILDLTSNLDYILENPLKVFVNEVADVNGDGEINVTDISGIVSIILNDPGVARGSSYDPYDWEYFSNKPIGEAKLIRRDGKIFLENDKSVTSLQFSFDSTIEYELSEEMKNMTVVNFVKDGMRTFIIYSYNNQRIDDLTDVIFDYLDLNDGDDFEIKDMSAGSEGGLSLSLKFSDESFFDNSENIIKIYPNPAISDVNLLTDITEKIEDIEVDIFNVLGVSVYRTNISSMGRLNNLDVSMLSSGVYTVRVRMITKGNKEVINIHKLIKK